MKKTSAGIIIKNEFDEFLLGHSTGNHFFDIFKGGTENNETPLDTALRESQEESGLIIDRNQVKDLGVFQYNKEKNLHLFYHEVKKDSIDMKSLVCSTFVTHPTYSFPEMDKFDWFTIEPLLRNTATSMNKIFKKIINEKIIHIEHIPDNLDSTPSSHELKKMKLK